MIVITIVIIIVELQPRTLTVYRGSTGQFIMLSGVSERHYTQITKPKLM